MSIDREQLKQRAVNVGNFLLDNLTGGKLGYQPFKQLDPSKVQSGDTLNILFTGASTGSGHQGWYPMSQMDDQNTHHQYFRWRDLDKARQLIKKLPKDVKVHIAGYSHGAQSANQLARQLKAPVDLIAPITRNYKQVVDWARVYEPTNRSPFYSINNLIAGLAGMVPKSQIDQKHSKCYQGEHCFGVGRAIRDAFSTEGIVPTQQQIQKQNNKSQLYRKIFRYLPVGIGIAGGVSGFTLARYLGIRNIVLRAATGGLSGMALYGLSRYLLNKLQKDRI